MTALRLQAGGLWPVSALSVFLRSCRASMAARAIGLALLLPAAAFAQSGQGPAEMPPPGFADEQFVDSRGCAFGRVQINGQARWVPRLRADRTPLCGLTPSLAASRPADSPVVTPVAARTTAPAQPQRQAQPSKAAARPAASSASRPVMVDGGEFVRYETDIPTVPCPRRYRARNIVCLDHAEYERLRETVAHRLLTTADGPPVSIGARHSAHVGGRYVQVGTFAVPSNAQNTVARLQAQGLPVARGNLRHGGQAMQVVLAGPFGSHAALQDALRRARAMGFSDAFIR